MKKFKEIMKEHQINWRKAVIPHIKGNGWQNGRSYEHILPHKFKEYNFYPGIRQELFLYIDDNQIKPHTGIHNLLSSWAVCSNFYWPFNNKSGFDLLKKYLNSKMSFRIKTITAMDLEYMDKDIELSPSALLGEDSGMRGSGQTSPDLAIRFITEDNKKGILLIESKFTEHSFYQCSGYSKTKPDRPNNPDKKRCLDTVGILQSDFENCHLLAWGRKYWDILKSNLNVELFNRLKKCPMSSACYQLFRQQALAKGYESRYDVVASCVFTDSRNESLNRSVHSSGLNDLPSGWSELFPELPFEWLTHNEWFEFVRVNNLNGQWNNWVKYIEERYINI